ncbi:MAG: hydrogenase [Desulfobacteraceae bacterium]|nr:hydrogenase [Desulfobacteraceae bacterium]
MTNPVETLLVLVLLSVLSALGSSRLPSLIKVLSFQGLVVSIVPLFMGHEMNTGSIIFTLVTFLIRAFAIPLYIYVAIRRVAIRREANPIVGYHASLLLGLVLIVAAIAVSPKFNLPMPQGRPLMLPTAVTLVVAGMFLIMSRRNAIAMVLGYMMMENGIYLVGTGFSLRAQHIVEFGILLDVLAGVMIMAVILQHIKQAFDSLDTARLTTLKE